MKKKRSGLTQTNIFNKEKYRAILKLIFHTQKQKIRFIHLKYALVKNHGIENGYERKILDNFFFTAHDKKLIEFYKKTYESKKISHADYVKAVKIVKQGAIKRLDGHGINLENAKFDSIFGLRKALKTLKEFNIIKSVKPKKGYSHYVFTDIGIALYSKWNIHYTIDNFIPNDYGYLKEIQDYIYKLVMINKLKK